MVNRRQMLKHAIQLGGAAIGGTVFSNPFASSTAFAQRPAPGSLGELRVAPSTPAPTVDVTLNGSQIAMELLLHVYDSIVTYDEGYRVIPNLATHWRISQDRTKYTFTLAPGIRFHNGDPVKVVDVVASIDRARSIGQAVAALKPITSVRTVDAATVEVTTAQPYALLLDALATPLPQVAVMPAKYARLTRPLTVTEIIGTGPYMVKEWRPDQYLLLARWAGYTSPTSMPATGLGGTRTAYHAALRFLFVKEEQTRLTGLIRGEYSYAQDLPTSFMKALAGKPAVQPLVMSQNSLLGFWLNQRDGQLLANLPLRQAMVAALDFTSVLRVTAAGDARFFKASGSLFWPEQTDKYYPEAGAKIYNHPNPARVQALLKQAGYHGEPLTIVTNRNYPYMYSEALEVSRQLNLAGIKTALKVLDWPGAGALFSQPTGWDMFASGAIFKPSLLDWKIIIAPDAPLAPGFKSDEMAKLFAEADAAFDQTQRQNVYRQIQDLVWQQVPFLPIGLLSGLDARASSLNGYRVYFIQRFWNVS
jgi:peptide/nickel transport system substrate-binding protein